MEQNEQIKDNGFENFDKHNKYKSLDSIKERWANVTGIISMIFYIIGFMFLYIFDMEKLSYIVIACWGMAFFASIIGYKIKKTSSFMSQKNAVLVHILQNK